MPASDHLQPHLFDPGPRYSADPVEGSLTPPERAPSKSDDWPFYVHPEHVKPRLFYSPDQYRDMVTDSVDIGYEATFTDQRTTEDTDGNTRWTNTMGTRPIEDMDDLWDAKLRESKRSRGTWGHGAGIYESVGKHGVQHQPVLNMTEDRDEDDNIVSTDMTHGEGHHRAASAMAHGHWLYPKINYEDYDRRAGHTDTGRSMWPTHEKRLRDESTY